LLGILRVTKDGSSAGGVDTDKTRALLAYICANPTCPDQQDGVYWVPLTAITAPELLTSSIA
jgi:hypothetical protein